jgi:tRNA(Met) C34 N-acetyltransferase TmcA
MSLCNGDYEEQVVVTAPNMKSYREYVVFIQNGIRLLDAEGNLIKTAEGEEMNPDRTMRAGAWRARTTRYGRCRGYRRKRI